MLQDFWKACDKFCVVSGNLITSAWHRVTHKATDTQQKVKPLVDTTFHAGMAFYTFYTTAVVSFSVLPLVVSSITLFAAVPLFSNLTNPYIYGIVFCIASATGYFKYQDLKRRNHLDELTETQQKDIANLKEELDLAHRMLNTLALSDPKLRKVKRHHQKEVAARMTYAPPSCDNIPIPTRKPRPLR